MGRHSDERDAAGNGSRIDAERSGAGSGVQGGYWGQPDGTDELSLLPASMFDDATALWDLRPYLRPHVDVELPEDPA